MLQWLILPLLLPTAAICSAVSNGGDMRGRQREGEEHQVRLIRDLLDNPNFDKRAIPVKGPHHPINVTMRMTLYQLIEVASGYC